MNLCSLLRYITIRIAWFISKFINGDRHHVSYLPLMEIRLVKPWQKSLHVVSEEKGYLIMPCYYHAIFVWFERLGCTCENNSIIHVNADVGKSTGPRKMRLIISKTQTRSVIGRYMYLRGFSFNCKYYAWFLCFSLFIGGGIYRNCGAWPFSNPTLCKCF